jgi:predicted ATPase
MKGARIMHIPSLADAYARVGRAAEGLALVEDGVQEALVAEFTMLESELYQCKGDLLLASGGARVDAETCFQHAIESAHRTEAKSWELRATLRLCRLWQQQGQVDAARHLLASVHGWFTEGFDTRDLQEARLLLDELTEQCQDR